MATFPTSADFRRQTPQPGTGVASYRPVRAAELGTEGAQTLYEQGRQNQLMARDIAALGERLDTAAAQDAVNQLRQIRQELTYDPEKGFRRFRGGDVLKPGPDGKPLLQGLPAAFQAKADEIAGKLISPGARELYQRAAAGEQLQYKRDMTVYFAGETEKFETASYKDGVNLDLAEAAQAYNDPSKIETIATRAEQRAWTFAQQRGLPGDASAIAARSNIYRVGVESLLASGDNRRALTFYEANKAKFDGQDATALQARLKSTATEVEAENVVQGYTGLKPPEGVAQYAPLVQQAATKYGVRPALALGVMAQESGGNPQAVSTAGAGGLMQLMPGTARDLGVTNVFDPAQNSDGGVRYLKQQLVRYNGNERLALMAYNWGPVNVDNWLKTGAAPDKIPTETRNYVHRVQAYAASYGSKADVKTAQMDILERTDLPSAVKASAYTQIEKRAAVFQAYQTAQIKQLDDTLEATTQAMIVDPASYKKGTLSQIADAYEAAGDRSKAVNTRILAAMEDFGLQFASSPDDAQRKVFTALLSGKAKSLAEGLIAGDAKTAAEAGRAAREEFSGLKEAAQAGVDLSTMQKKARGALDLAVRANDQVLAKDITDFFESHVAAQSVGQAPPVAQQQAIEEMRAKIEKGQQANVDIMRLRAAQEIMQKQDAAFAKDAFTAGTSLYPEVGKPVALNWADAPDTVAAALNMRAMQARQISARRGGIAVVPFSDQEVAQLRSMLDAAPPDQQARIMRTLSGLPADQIPVMAAALAGKQDTGDPLSRSYASALSLFADRDPARAAVADQVLRGARLIKEMGDAGRKPQTSSDAWQSQLQTKLGNVFTDRGAKVPAVIADSVASVYVYQMFRAGKQGDKTDTDVLNQAIDAVVGKTVTRNGQVLLPPKGVDTYRFDEALRTLTNGDTDRLRTTEGDPITADVIYRRGVLTNVGDGLYGDGIYKVRIPDPRRGGDLSEVMDPDTGRAWLLDIKPLLARPAVQGGAPDRDYAPMGPRRAVGNRYLPQPGPTP